MGSFVAIKFNPRTDSERPKRGDIFEHEGKNYVTKSVSWISLSKVMHRKSEHPLKGFDKIFYVQHTTRPAVIWIVWGNLV